MSSFHRITSLLNASNGSDADTSTQNHEPESAIGATITDSGLARREPPGSNILGDNCFNKIEDARLNYASEFGFSKADLKTMPGHGPLLTYPIFSSLQSPPVQPALSASSSMSVGSSLFRPPANTLQRVIREQPIYTSNDYRYWPYEAQSQPTDIQTPYSPMPTLISSTPQTQKPQILTHEDIQQHVEAMYPGVMVDYSIRIRQRRTRACINCRAKKIKCEGSGPQCTSCISIGIKCRWRPIKKRGPKPKGKEVIAKNDQEKKPLTFESILAKIPSAEIGGAETDHVKEKKSSGRVSASSYKSTESVNAPVDLDQSGLTIDSEFNRPHVEATLADKHDQQEILRRFYSDEVSEETRDAVVYYFNYFYGTCSIFHPALFVRQIVEGKVDPMLIDAMRVTTARIIAKKTGKTFDFEKLASKILQNIFSRIHSGTLDYICAIVLMASYSGGEGDFLMYNSLAQLAVSLVVRFGWNTLDIDKRKRAISWDEWVTLEIKRRIFWFIYIMDSYQSILGSRAGTIGDNRLFISAPGSDETWDDITIPQSSNWPSDFNPYETKGNIVEKASLSHAFQDLCNVATIAANVNEFLWNFGISLKTTSTSDDLTPNIKYLRRPDKHVLRFKTPVTSAFEFDEFRRLHNAVKDWQDGIIRAEDLKMDIELENQFTEFGSKSHRLCVMRWRYFCLYGYAVSLYFILHLSNRPSFFSKPAEKESDDQTPNPTAENVEDDAIRGLLTGVFSKPMYDNFLAYDVVKDSWDLCLDAVFSYVKFLDRNADIPLERYDQVMPLSTFIAITVLVRHICILRQNIKKADRCKDAEDNNIRQTREKFIECVSSLRRLWSLLLDLGAVWKTKGMQKFLRTMQVEEITNATELLSGIII